MPLPSDLLAAYLEALASGENEVTDEEQAEGALTATLSSCSELANLSPVWSVMPSRESKEEQYRCCSSVLGSALFDGGFEIIEAGDGGDGKEWNATIKLLRLILALPESVVGEKATNRSSVAPHIVMRTVIDNSLDYCDFDDDDYNEDESVDTCGSCAIDTKSILLILLSSASVRLTASDIRRTLASSTDSKIRWRRASSVAMECIGLYQRLVLERLQTDNCQRRGARGNSNTKSEECSELIDATTLLSKYVADAIFGLLSVFQEHNGTAPVEKIEAGLISAMSMTTRFVNTLLGKHNPMLSHQLSLDLVASCISPLRKIQLDTILLNPLRQWDYDRVNSNRHVDDSYSSDDDEESDADAQSAGEIFAEMVCGRSSADNPGGMKTYWDCAGIAFLAHHIVKDRTMMPVYSCELCFVLLYPQSGVLLQLGQSDDEQFGSDERFTIIANSIELLSHTLELSNSCSSTNDSMPYAHISRDVETPLGPVGTIQLLLNTAIALPDTPGGLTNGIGEGQNGQDNMTKSKILGVVRRLLNSHSQLQHVRAVASLLQRCPFDYLKPVLLDLLRPALLTDTDTGKAKEDGDVEVETLDLLESSVLGEMKSHVANGDDGDDSGGSSCIYLIDVDGLISKVEQYTCAVSLVRLLLIRRRGKTQKQVNPDTTRLLESAVNTLNEFLDGLCKVLDDAAYSNLFQLHLLADALRELERQSTATATS